MSKLLTALVLTAFASFGVQAASHAGAAPMKAASGAASAPAKADKAAAPAKADKKEDKKAAAPAASAAKK